MSQQIENENTDRSWPDTGAQGRIMVGVDGSVEAKAALRWAGAIARRTGAVIEAVTVWQFPSTYSFASVCVTYSTCPVVIVPSTGDGRDVRARLSSPASTTGVSR